MEWRFLLLILPNLLCANPIQALNQQVTWPVIAHKNSEPAVILLHRGQQTISTTNTADQVLAVKFSYPGSGITLQAKVLNSTVHPFSIKLNGVTLTRNYQLLPFTNFFYLSYHKTGPLAERITESGYELITYWQR